MSGLFTLEHDRFLTHPNFGEGQIVIAPKHLNRNFADLITRVFPNVEQLFYDVYVNSVFMLFDIVRTRQIEIGTSY